MGFLAFSRTAYAQSEDAPQQLDDLIPDSAVSSPEGWAVEEASRATLQTDDKMQSDPLVADDPVTLPELEFDAPLLMPDTEAEPEPDLFAAVEDLPLPSPPQLATTRIDDQLALALPADRSVLPNRAALISRFKTLRETRMIVEEQDNIALRAARIRADRELLEELLRAYGYFDARVWRQFDELDEHARPHAETAMVRFAVLPGVRYRFGAIELGRLATAPDHEALRQHFAIEAGDPLLSDRIVQQRDALAMELGETGYPFAAIEDPQLLIDHARSEGDLTMPVEPGGKFVFGDITSNMPEFLSARHIGRIARFEPGDTYKQSLELDLRRALLSTGLLSSVNITRRPVEEPIDGKPGELAMDVEVQKGRLRTIAGAVGYGTEDGFKLQASWEHRNLFPSEGALRIRGVLGTRELLAGIGVRKNNFRARDQLLAFDAYGSDVKTEAVEARTIGMLASFERNSNLLFQKRFSWQVGAELLFTDERNRVIAGIPRPRQEYLVGSLFARTTFDTSDSLLDPTHGIRLSMFVAPEVSRAFGEDEYYVRLEADGSFYLPLSDGMTLAARAKGATIRGTDAFRIAPSRRLYAGGGSSVRGYGYQAVGPRNDFGEPTGGTSLVELSAEARIDTGLFDGALQVVPFFDLGTVSIDSTPDFRFIRYGAGMGIRYKTGFGPIRVDLGVPLNRDPLFDSPLAVYVSLGQAF